ncbi:MAG: hypothetical protein MJ252_17750 [archaeon]|nr:hypothetical protein [archaeon]
MNIALSMNWESKARYAVLVCDAPCHGKAYHNVIFDKFNNGDPNGLIMEDLIEQFFRKNITLYCVEINSSTCKMFEMMRSIYEKGAKNLLEGERNEIEMKTEEEIKKENKEEEMTNGAKENTERNTYIAEFHVETLGSASNKFPFFVACSASDTLNHFTYGRTKLEDVINKFREDTIEAIVKKYSKEEISKADIDSLLISTIEGLNLNETEQKLFDFINRMSSLNIEKNSFIKIEEKKEPEETINLNIDKSSIQYNSAYKSIIHYLRCSDENTIINKWESPLTQHNTVRSIFMIDNENDIIEDSSEYNIKLYDQYLDLKLKTKSKKKKIKNIYNDSSKVIDSLLNDYAICNYVVENFNLRLNDLFPSYQINLKFLKEIVIEAEGFPSKYLYGKFSSYEKTYINKSIERNLLEAFSHFSYQISEGNILITDLQLNNNNEIVEYKISNINKDGHKDIMKFFVNHYCNEICKKINLIHPRKKNTSNLLHGNFYCFNQLSNTKLCELCKKPIGVGDKELCERCKVKTMEKRKKEFCKDCHCTFSYSPYYYNMKMYEYPKTCEDCTVKF